MMYLTYSNYNTLPIYSPAFKGVKTRKLISKVENTKILNKLEITFDELERMYNEIGYDFIRKRGSHVTVHLTDNITIAVVIPHGKKYVHINDIKRFLLVKEGKFKEATLVNR